jgi:hypothetical protein
MGGGSRFTVPKLRGRVGHPRLVDTLLNLSFPVEHPHLFTLL